MHLLLPVRIPGSFHRLSAFDSDPSLSSHCPRIGPGQVFRTGPLVLLVTRPTSFASFSLCSMLAVSRCVSRSSSLSEQIAGNPYADPFKRRYLRTRILLLFHPKCMRPPRLATARGLLETSGGEALDRVDRSSQNQQTQGGFRLPNEKELAAEFKGPLDSAPPNSVALERRRRPA